MVRYGLAVLATAVTLLLSGAISRLAGEKPSFLLLFLPVLLSAWYGGFGPGVLSAMLACASIELPLAASSHSLALSRFMVARMAMFFPEAVIVSWFIASHREVLTQLAALVKHSDDAIIGAKLDGTITTWNSGAELIYGYSAAEIIGHPFAILCPPERPDEAQELKAKVECGEHVRRFETVRMRKDGTRVDVSITVSPIKDVTSMLIGVSALARDITERKRAERALSESEERFRVMADTVRAMSWSAK